MIASLRAVQTRRFPRPRAAGILTSLTWETNSPNLPEGAVCVLRGTNPLRQTPGIPLLLQFA
jgi:hypothetical protein